jgi:alkylation response protein AidB-like acyl-CoA dehydrogenase
MRFELSDDAAALRDATADLVAAEVPPAVVRAGWPGGDREPLVRAWHKLADVGIVGTLTSDEVGGLGLDETSLVPMLEALGYSGLPLPVVETIAVAVPLLAEVRDPRLGAVLTGDALVAGVLDGSDVVPYAQQAELLVRRDDAAIVVHRIADVESAPARTVDGGRAAARIWRTGTGDLLTDDPVAIDTAWQRGVLGTSAVLLGLAGRALDMTVSYVKQRKQFGVPVGSFQAVKHALASAHVQVEFARPLVQAAGWALANREPDAASLVSSGKVLASDAARLVARAAIQCHGAMGYTTEYDLHLFVKEMWALAASWGTAGWHRARLAETLGV